MDDIYLLITHKFLYIKNNCRECLNLLHLFLSPFHTLSFSSLLGYMFGLFGFGGFRPYLFWLQTKFRNDFPENRLFGWSRKLGQTKNIFSVDRKISDVGRKWFEMKIFTSNHFQTHTQREREIAPRERSNPEPRAFRLRTLRLRRSTSTLNLTQIAPFNFADEPRALRLHTLQLRCLTSTSNHTQITPFDFASEPRAQIMPSTLPRSHPRIAPRRHRSHRSHWDRNWEMVGFWWIFFGWVLFLCLSIEKWYYIFIWKLRKCEEQEENVFSILFSATQPNSRKYFPKHFLECNQTLENIFLFQK